MITRVVNLVLASGAALIVLPKVYVARHTDVASIIIAFVLMIWLFGAIGLFLRSRIAWRCSIFGVCGLVCFLVAFLLSTIWDIISHAKEIPRDPGMMFASIFCPAVICVELALSVGLAIRLVRLRKTLFCVPDEHDS